LITFVLPKLGLYWHHIYCTWGNRRSDPFNREKALSQKTRIALFSDPEVKSAAVKLSTDWSQRFFEKQKTTTCDEADTDQILRSMFTQYLSFQEWIFVLQVQVWRST
jgi:hypothetical protein